jgi:Flavin-binding monooxygenase-like
VKGLSQYQDLFPARIVHSKIYRTPQVYKNKKVLVIGNSASGHDVAADLVSTADLPVYQSRRSASRWDGSEPPPGTEWKPVIREYLPSGRIVFEDDTYLDDIDVVIYCTGYKPSYPFWNVQNNGREIWDYEKNKLFKTYLHTFFQDFSTLGIVGVPRVLTFRSFEYQAIALARLFANRQTVKLPNVREQERWEKEREETRRRQKKKYHDIEWETGETMNWLESLYRIAGLGLLTGEGRQPPVLKDEVRWAIEHLRKYPEPGKGSDDNGSGREGNGRAEDKQNGDDAWILVERGFMKDLLAFI